MRHHVEGQVAEPRGLHTRMCGCERMLVNALSPFSRSVWSSPGGFNVYRLPFPDSGEKNGALSSALFNPETFYVMLWRTRPGLLRTIAKIGNLLLQRGGKKTLFFSKYRNLYNSQSIYMNCTNLQQFIKTYPRKRKRNKTQYNMYCLMIYYFSTQLG